ncbi:MAG: DUF503 domain-containing protein [Pseudomonadales bacterium]|nr:DUF503 domain-containing protein [Pseudomonadales bacterium]
MAKENTFHVGLIVIELHIPYSHSLKEKRMALRSLKDILGKQYNVSVNEVGFQDNWQRAQIACSAVSNEVKRLQQLQAKIESYIIDYVDAELIYCDLEIL